MLAIDKFVAKLPGRMEESQLAGSDPESYRLHVEFVHAHGVPKGPITTLSNACAVTAAVIGPNGRKATRGT